MDIYQAGLSHDWKLTPVYGDISRDSYFPNHLMVEGYAMLKKNKVVNPIII